MRWDIGTVRADDSTVSQTAGGFGPRLSVIADVTNDAKTIAQISYGRTTELPSLRAISSYDGSRRSSGITEQYNATTRRFEFFTLNGGADGSRLSFDHTPAMATRFLLSFRRELAKGVLARTDYTYRFLHNQYEDAEIYAITDPTGTRTIGWVNGVPLRITKKPVQPAVDRALLRPRPHPRDEVQRLRDAGKGEDALADLGRVELRESRGPQPRSTTPASSRSTTAIRAVPTRGTR